MKFYDKNGKKHNSYLHALKSDIFGKVDTFIEKKFPGYKESQHKFNLKSYEFNNSENEYPIIEYDMEIPSNELTETFVPGVTPKVQCSKKHAITIDYENHILKLTDESGNVINTTKFDSKLENCPTKDLINMVYEITDLKTKEDK